MEAKSKDTAKADVAPRQAKECPGQSSRETGEANENDSRGRKPNKRHQEKRQGRRMKECQPDNVEGRNRTDKKRKADAEHPDSRPLTV